MKKLNLAIGLAYLCMHFQFCSKGGNAAAPVQSSDPVSSIGLLSVSKPVIPSETFNVTNYGASTSSSNNTTAIQNAINAANAAGGGTVSIPSGTFLSGPLQIKNNVNLQLSSGTILKALAYGTYPGSGGTADVAPLINLAGSTNAKISGPGVLEGQGSAWWSAYATTKASGNAIARPAMIGLTSASTIEISGITIQNAPNSHIGIGKNNNSVTVSGVTINSPESSPNTDGIDIWSPNVDVLNCNISCGDDNIAMNSNSEYVNISNCTFGTGHGCSIGSYASNVNHITVDNCTFNGTDNGVRIKSNRTRSGVVQYLTYSNLTMTNVSNPFFIAEYYPDNTIPSTANGDVAQTITTTTPVWKYMTFKNITVTGADKAGIIWAVPEKAMRDLTFDNVKITAAVGMKMNYANNVIFTNGSKITASSGNAFISTYQSSITGINLTTGVPQ
ncbi:glycoside hydrolase family 28 protein [Pinibacter aurantiacus]|uniref:Glycoside hydrolase family 28 protein n=1 Tax=Pinibacter aurantiacus TaxID=2851599 RepID=A0A9E2W3X7_9BACT|nr:glycosyl hydrolase family 28 protein [Pinibacter aurantiacus]MBV4357289.1 glycoside hydrolase family 28 protein [Pinibacter aurantiacus]